MSERVNILLEKDRVRTQGLVAYGCDELGVILPDASHLPEVETFIQHVVEGLKSGTHTVHGGGTLTYGYWTVHFRQEAVGNLSIWEHSADLSHLVPGIVLTLGYWRDQHEMCSKVHAEFHPPRHDQMVAISKGVLDGDVVQGVRYPSPGHMSGWWITSDRYDGNISSLTTEHLYHLTAARPSLARYLALPVGFRFDFQHGEDIWFDQNAANQPANK